MTAQIPAHVFGFSGYSGSGKTTLIEKLVPRFTAAGLRVSLIKHTHHQFDIDRPGKDSYRHRQAGCREVLVSSDQRWALMHELRGEPEPALAQLVARLAPCDLVLVEGFKRDPVPKLEVYRHQPERPPRYPGDDHIVALATDTALDCALPQFGLNAVDAIAAFILQTLDIHQKHEPE